MYIYLQNNYAYYILCIAYRSDFLYTNNIHTSMSIKEKCYPTKFYLDERIIDIIF